MNKPRRGKRRQRTDRIESVEFPLVIDGELGGELLIDEGEVAVIDCGEHGTVVATSREDALDKLLEIFGHGHELNLDAYLEVRGLLAKTLNKLQWATEQPLEEVEETPKPRRKSRVVERGYER